MKTHHLNIDKARFMSLLLWRKNFVVRFDDRDFRERDTIFFEETEHTAVEMKDGAPLEFTGRRFEVEITSKLKGQAGLEPGWCVLGIRVNGIDLVGTARREKYKQLEE
ncbi:MAG: DUF3850 domain-containing protein [Kiritimatiellia bacterium]